MLRRLQRHVRQDAGRMVFNQSELGQMQNRSWHGDAGLCRSQSFISVLVFPSLCLVSSCPSLDAHLDGLHASAVSGSGIRVWGLWLDTLSPRCLIGTSAVSLRRRYKILWTEQMHEHTRRQDWQKQAMPTQPLTSWILTPDDASAAPLWDASLVEPDLRSPPAMQSL